MSPGTALLDPLALSLAVALGAGLLVGIERERRKGQGDNRGAAGLRSFAVAAVMGALAEGLARPGLVIAGAVLVLMLSTLAYWKSRSFDPGVTTELALFVTYLIGVLAVPAPMLAAACAAALAALLAARDGMHRFATQWLTVEELRDGLLLAALGLREALIVAALLASVAWSVNQARAAFGDVGLDLGIALAALVDAHAPVASLAAMHAAGSIPLDHVVRGVLIAISANSITRAVVAALSGGPVFALRVAAARALSLAAAWLVAWALG